MEISNNVAFDRAFGKHLHTCPWASRHKDLQDFNVATSKQRIYRGENEDPDMFLINVAKSAKDAVTLPIVGYFRSPDVPVNMEDFMPITAELLNKLSFDVWDIETTYSTGDIKKVDDTAYKSQQDDNLGHDPETDDGTWWKVYNTLKQFNIRYQNRTASVNVLVVGHGRAAVDEVALPLETYLQDNRVIYIPYRMFFGVNDQTAAKFNLPAIIKEPDNITFSDVTVKKDGITQIFAKSASYEVNLPFLSGHQIAPVDIEVEFMPIIANW
ncbi:hypothetical protein KKI24_28980 [bacterium]|nr:hypothetical protein [bacterium]